MKLKLLTGQNAVAHSLAAVMFFSVVLLPILGCGGNRGQVQVSGVVYYKNKPVEKARVTFYLEGGRPASGTTDANGRFTLMTFDPADGAALGTHDVVVAKTEPTKNPDPSNPTKMVDHLLPLRYTHPSSSGLTATVTEDGENVFRFDLTDDS